MTANGNSSRAGAISRRELLGLALGAGAMTLGGIVMAEALIYHLTPGDHLRHPGNQQTPSPGR